VGQKQALECEDLNSKSLARAADQINDRYGEFTVVPAEMAIHQTRTGFNHQDYNSRKQLSHDIYYVRHDAYA
jgi:hypothetical protein